MKFEIMSIDDATSVVWLKQVVLYNTGPSFNGKVDLLDMLEKMVMLGSAIYLCLVNGF